MRRATIGTTLALLAVAIAACAPYDITVDSGARDVPVEPPRRPPRTLTFVVDHLDIDPNDDPSIPHTGFNLDDFYSTDVDPMGCAHYDYQSMYDDDQHCASVTNERCDGPPGCHRSDPGCVGGVDNQLPTLANTIRTAADIDVRARIAEAVTHNRYVLLVRVREIDDWMNDLNVGLSIYRAYPTFRSDCDRVLPGREYAIDGASIVTGGTDIDRDAAFRYTGSIVAGRIRVRATEPSPALDLPLVFTDYEMRVPLRSIRLRANIAADELTAGNVGGIVHGDDLVPNCRGLCPPDYVSVVRGVIGGLTDIQIDGVCDGSSLSPPRYGGIAVGFGIHAVPATVAPQIVSGPPVGTCGSSADAGALDP